MNEHAYLSYIPVVFYNANLNGDKTEDIHLIVTLKVQL